MRLIIQQSMSADHVLFGHAFHARINIKHKAETVDGCLVISEQCMSFERLNQMMMMMGVPHPIEQNRFDAEEDLDAPAWNQPLDEDEFNYHDEMQYFDDNDLEIPPQ
jgi:hypothetical protein